MMIKVCGMRDTENIREVEALGIDLMGFIFWPKSSRYVSERPAYLPTNCKCVGVFVDEDIETVRRIADDYALEFIQLHGHESADYCAQLKGLKLIKAISVSGQDDIATYKTYEGLVDYYLFDTKCPSVGGSACSQPMMATHRFSSVVALAPMMPSASAPVTARSVSASTSTLASKSPQGLKISTN